MRFCCLGSGSEGNSMVLESGSETKTRILVDCGLKFDLLEQRLFSQGISGTDINGIFITHEHGDHVRSAAKFARLFKIPIFMTHGSLYACSSAFKKIEFLSILRSDETTILNGLKILPFAIPHDAREPVALVFEDSKHRLGILTDTGSITPHIIKKLSKLDGLILEFNYDSNMLEKSKYPYALKKRISSSFGHLSNNEALKLLDNIFHNQLQVIVAAHLSQKNNTPELVGSKLKVFMNGLVKSIIADQVKPTGWVNLN